jgi:hypothetical protein
MESVTKVIPQDGYQLLLTFNTFETKLFDAQPYLEKGVFTYLGERFCKSPKQEYNLQKG